MRLPDPNPSLTVGEVINLYATTYPEITTAAIEGPEVIGNKLVYTGAEVGMGQEIEGPLCAPSLAWRRNQIHAPGDRFYTKAASRRALLLAACARPRRVLAVSSQVASG